VKIWQSSDKNNFAQFFETQCINCIGKPIASTQLTFNCLLLLLLTKTFRLLYSIVHLLNELLIAAVWRQIKTVEARVTTRQPCLFAYFLYTEMLWTVASWKHHKMSTLQLQLWLLQLPLQLLQLLPLQLIQQLPLQLTLTSQLTSYGDYSLFLTRQHGLSSISDAPITSVMR